MRDAPRLFAQILIHRIRQDKIHFFVNFQKKELPLQKETAFGMIVTFDKDYLRELYETGKADKKHRFQPDIVNAI